MKRTYLLTALGLAAVLLVGQASAAPQWREGREYRTGEILVYHGKPYRVLQSHTAWRGAGWTPQAAPSLWEPVGKGRWRDDGRRYGRDRDHDDDDWDDDDRWDRDDDRPWLRKPDWRPVAWERGHHYRKGEWVWYEGNAYRAQRDVNSGVSLNWKPHAAPEVWLRVSLP
ncbi:carbohydrate-binding protein [Chitiniphilus shinanonensis]|uniref:carbohydrate-binding protein n=1 Tax=Chitiniphilus shinanonensis TaxID=553088 RepID=UPI00305179CB